MTGRGPGRRGRGCRRPRAYTADLIPDGCRPWLMSRLVAAPSPNVDDRVGEDRADNVVSGDNADAADGVDAPIEVE